MVYLITKNEQQIAHYKRVSVGPAGELYCNNEWGTRIQICFAPGQWDNYYWEDEES